ncbi:DUF2249 domain-containing protein [bacterium]|nr:DUF2249 domain-containing protein [bacterium]MBU1883331.1 DUF2249 domain-containing protein [bacterium]
MANKEIILDVSELEAPLPLLKGIEAIKNLKSGETLVFIHRMFPCKLHEQIDKLGLRSDTVKDEENYFEIKIYR